MTPRASREHAGTPISLLVVVWLAVAGVADAEPDPTLDDVLFGAPRGSGSAGAGSTGTGDDSSAERPDTPTERTSEDEAGERRVTANEAEAEQAPPAGSTEPEPAARSSRSTSQRPLEEIVVTATRRAASLQDASLAVTAFDHSVLEDREITSVEDLHHFVPGLVFGHTGGAQQISIRGVGLEIPTISGEPGIAIYVDDIYQGRPYLSLAALHDVERIEVLRGPQGTLYGRNASGGAVRFVSRRPVHEPEADLSIQYGSYDQVLTRGSASGPVPFFDDRLLGRITLVLESRNGYYQELTRDRDLEDMNTIGFRGSLLAMTWDWISLEASGDFQKDRWNGPAFWSTTPNFGSIFTDSAASPALSPFDLIIADVEEETGFVLGPLRDQVLGDVAGGNRTDGPPTAYHDHATKSDRWFGNARFEATAELGFADLTGLYGFGKNGMEFIADTDGTDQPIFSILRDDASTQHSAELQLASTGWGNLNWIGGFYFYHESANEIFRGPLFAFAPITALPKVTTDGGVFFGDAGLVLVDFTVHDQTTRSYAGFGNADYTFFDLVRLNGGIRYTHDEKSFLESFRALPGATTSCDRLLSKASWNDVSLKGGLDVFATENTLVYGSYTQGFKAGGFNATGCGDQYDPEFVDAFELGVKTELFDHRLRLNLAGFDYAYDNIQTVRTTAVTQEVINGPEAEMRGVEAELMASPFGSLMLNGNFAWLDAEYVTFRDDDSLTPFEGERNLAGNRLPKTPEITFSVGAQYTFPFFSLGFLTPRYDFSYTDGYFFTAFNEPAEKQESYHMSNAFLIFDHASEAFSLKGFVKNIEEEYVRTGVIPTAPIGSYLANFGPPRTWGIEATFRF